MIRSALLGAMLVLSVPAQALAGVTVKFIDPDRYSDAGQYGAGSREATLAAFRSYLVGAGDRFLPPGQTLSIEFLDIDLAGHVEPWRIGMSDVRILRGVTPPRIRLRWVLSEKGRRLRRGEETLTDLTYQMNIAARTSGDRYAYEKALLADWLRSTFPRLER